MRNNLPVTGVEFDYPETSMLVSATDLSSRIEYCNPAFVEVSGFSREELIGQPHNLIRHPSMPPQAFEDMWATIKAGRSWTALVKNRRKNGDHYWVRANVTPIDRARPGSKHHVLVDANGVPLVAILTGANTNDVTQLLPLVDAIPPIRGVRGRPLQKPGVVYADRGYDSTRHRRALRERGIKPVIAKRRTEHGSGLGKYRWVPFSYCARTNQMHVDSPMYEITRNSIGRNKMIIGSL